jgi:tetrapyrrole methylase family protein/MazG family protein
MVDYPEKQGYTAEDLVKIVEILRDSEQGCPWDKVQTHASIRMNFLEEVYEVLDAIDAGDPVLLREELGDVLMQVALHAQMEREKGTFCWNDVCDEVCRKLICRHPHIFGAKPGMEGINDWELLKNKEKGRATLRQDLESVPKAMPALMRAAKLQKRAAHWRTAEKPPEAEIYSAMGRLEADQMSADGEQEIGQLLFSAVALARKYGVDPEQALQKANDRFVQMAKP